MGGGGGGGGVWKCLLEKDGDKAKWGGLSRNVWRGVVILYWGFSGDSSWYKFLLEFSKMGGLPKMGGGWVVFKMMGDVLTPPRTMLLGHQLVVLSYFHLKKVNYPIFMLV